MTLAALTTTEIKALNKSGGVSRSIRLGDRIAALEAADVETADSPDLVSLATAGLVAWNKISLATNPTANDTITIGADTYQFKAAAGSLTNNAYIAVVRDSTNDLTAAALVKAINRTSVDAEGLPVNTHASIFLTNGTTKANAWGTENVKAVYDASGNVLWLFAADAPGGALVDGTAPDIACTDALTAVVGWSYSNLNGSVSAGQKYTANARWTVAVTAGLIAGGTVDVVLPFYSADAVGRVIGYTSGEILKEGIADYVSLAAGPMANTTIATLNLAGGGGDLADTDLAWIEVWCPTTEAASITVTEAEALGGRIDSLDTEVGVLQGEGRVVFAKGITAEDNSTGVTAGTNETAFTNYVVIPADTLAVGDRIRVTAKVSHVTDNAGDTVALVLAFAAAAGLVASTCILSSVAAVDASAGSWFLTADLRVVAIGAAATAELEGTGFSYKTGATPAFLGTDLADHTSVATNAVIHCGVTYLWNASNAANVVRLKNLFVTVTRPST